MWRLTRAVDDHGGDGEVAGPTLETGAGRLGRRLLGRPQRGEGDVAVGVDLLDEVLLGGRQGGRLEGGRAGLDQLDVDLLINSYSGNLRQ